MYVTTRMEKEYGLRKAHFVHSYETVIVCYYTQEKEYGSRKAHFVHSYVTVIVCYYTTGKRIKIKKGSLCTFLCNSDCMLLHAGKEYGSRQAHFG